KQKLCFLAKSLIFVCDIRLGVVCFLSEPCDPSSRAGLCPCTSARQIKHGSDILWCTAGCHSACKIHQSQCAGDPGAQMVHPDGWDGRIDVYSHAERQACFLPGPGLQASCSYREGLSNFAARTDREQRCQSFCLLRSLHFGNICSNV